MISLGTGTPPADTLHVRALAPRGVLQCLADRQVTANLADGISDTFVCVTRRLQLQRDLAFEFFRRTMAGYANLLYLKCFHSAHFHFVATGNSIRLLQAAGHSPAAAQHGPTSLASADCCSRRLAFAFDEGLLMLARSLQADDGSRDAWLNIHGSFVFNGTSKPRP